MKPIDVLSCFDGISAGQVTLERTGIPVKSYHAFEIDKYAIKVTQSHYPETVQLGDIQEWKKWRNKIPVPDLIIGGSPCQGFSNAGYGLNFDDPRSKLFFVFCDILAWFYGKNPNLKYLLENVRMKKEWMDVITDRMKVEPILINSSLVSAQSRQRLYWTNISHIDQPEDRKIFLKDIIVDGEVDREKSYAIDANYYKGGSEKYLKKIYYGKAKRQVVKYQSAKRLMVKNDEHYRKLFPVECERLQTLPDGYTEGVSNTQRYKMLGNSWTVDVIVHLLGYFKKEYTRRESKMMRMNRCHLRKKNNHSLLRNVNSLS